MISTYQNQAFGSNCGLQQSNCKTINEGKPCRLAKWDKNNTVCYNCDARIGGEVRNSSRHDRQEEIKRQKAEQQLKKNPTRVYLGSVCRRGHVVLDPFTDEERTVRYSVGGKCVDCHRETARVNRMRIKNGRYMEDHND